MPYSAHAIVESIIKKLGSSDLVTLVKRGLRYGEKSGKNSGEKAGKKSRQKFVKKSSKKSGEKFDFTTFSKYRKVASSSTSRLVARPKVFRLFMKGKFDPYVL